MLLYNSIGQKYNVPGYYNCTNGNYSSNNQIFFFRGIYIIEKKEPGFTLVKFFKIPDKM